MYLRQYGKLRKPGRRKHHIPATEGASRNQSPPYVRKNKYQILSPHETILLLRIKLHHSPRKWIAHHYIVPCLIRRYQKSDPGQKDNPGNPASHRPHPSIQTDPFYDNLKSSADRHRLFYHYPLVQSPVQSSPCSLPHPNSAIHNIPTLLLSKPHYNRRHNHDFFSIQ